MEEVEEIPCEQACFVDSAESDNLSCRCKRMPSVRAMMIARSNKSSHRKPEEYLRLAHLERRARLLRAEYCLADLESCRSSLR